MPPDDTDQANDPFRIWASAQSSSNPTHMGMVGITVKLGPRVCKTVLLSRFGNPDTGEVSTRELRVAAYDRVDGGFDFDNPTSKWAIQNEEISRLLAFLNHDVDQPGRYRVVDAESPLGDLVTLAAERGDAGIHELMTTLTAGADPRLIADALVQSESGMAAAETAVLTARRELVARATARALEPDVTETHMQDIIGNAWWLFGGRYVGILARRDLLQLDQHDMPLITADGALHIVELKGPRIEGLIKKHRNHWIVGREVHEATMQAVNYIRSADENGAALQTLAGEELGIVIGLRRVFATVVIGHRDHVVAPEMPPEQFDLALRTYNATLSRVQVITYDQLIAAAARSLDFTGLG